MSHSEDVFFEIYNDIQEKKLKSKFDAQLKKMKYQEKHQYKSTKELWEYAYNKVTSSFTSKDNLG
jgi:nuclear transport factor 2 (NTF2) superfamily protein